MIWRACERLGIFPPGVRQHWAEMDLWTQESVIAYQTVRSREDNERDKMFIEAGASCYV